MGWNQYLTKCNSEILEGLSGEDEVERMRPLVEFLRGRGRDEAGIFFLILGLFEDKTSSGILAFFSAILRTRLLILVFRGRGRDEARNFA